MKCAIIRADQETLMSLGGLLKSSQTCHQRLKLNGSDYVGGDYEFYTDGRPFM